MWSVNVSSAISLHDVLWQTTLSWRNSVLFNQCIFHDDKRVCSEKILFFLISVSSTVTNGSVLKKFCSVFISLQCDKMTVYHQWSARLNLSYTCFWLTVCFSIVWVRKSEIRITLEIYCHVFRPLNRMHWQLTYVDTLLWYTCMWHIHMRHKCHKKSAKNNAHSNHMFLIL